jgi:hypothetical protein
LFIVGKALGDCGDVIAVVPFATLLNAAVICNICFNDTSTISMVAPRVAVL